MKFIRRLIWFLVFSAIIGFGGSLYLAKNYENSLKVFAVKQINKQLAAEIGVEDVQFTVFKKFPFTSLEFTNVLAKDAMIKVGEQDTFSTSIMHTYNLTLLISSKTGLSYGKLP